MKLDVGETYITFFEGKYEWIGGIMVPVHVEVVVSIVYLSCHAWG